MNVTPSAAFLAWQAQLHADGLSRVAEGESYYAVGAPPIRFDTWEQSLATWGGLFSAM